MRPFFTGRAWGVRPVRGVAGVVAGRHRDAAGARDPGKMLHASPGTWRRQGDGPRAPALAGTTPVFGLFWLGEKSFPARFDLTVPRRVCGVVAAPNAGCRAAGTPGARGVGRGAGSGRGRARPGAPKNSPVFVVIFFHFFYSVPPSPLTRPAGACWRDRVGLQTSMGACGCPGALGAKKRGETATGRGSGRGGKNSPVFAVIFLNFFLEGGGGKP